MNSQWRTLSLSLLSILLIPSFAEASAISVNGTCEVNDCSTAGLQSSALTVGQSEALTPFSFTYTAGSGDQFLISGDYSASFSSGITLFTNFSATYTGSSPSTAPDSFTVHVLQDFNGGDPSDTWDSPPDYSEHVPAVVGDFTTFSFNDCFDTTHCVGAVGPLNPGTYNDTVMTALTGIAGQYLADDFQFTFNFAASAPTGTTDVVLPAAIPEPAQTIPVALVLAALSCAIIARKRKFSRQEAK